MTARLVLLFVLLLVLALVSTFAVGPKWIPVQEWWTILSDGGSGSHGPIIWQIRLPRVLLAVFIGGGLGCAGAGFQGLFRNALADPFVIGASSGAALGATLMMSTRLKWSLWSGLDLRYLSALIGALVVVALVYAIASMGRGIPTIALLLAGVAVSSFVGAVVSLIMFVRNDQLHAIFGWLMGSLSGRQWPSVYAAAPLIVIGSLGLWLLSRPLDCLTFGDETTASLGIDISRARALIILAASLTTAAAVAAAGIIGFIGLIAPHIARLWLGTSRHELVLPGSCLAGALLLLISDDISRTVVGDGELPVGVITALLGGPFFIYLLRTKRYYVERRS